MIEVVEGQTSPRVSCSGNAYPPLQYQWYRNGKQLNDGQIFQKYEKLTRDDGGEYMCIATNKHGNKTAVLNISILCE